MHTIGLQMLCKLGHSFRNKFIDCNYAPFVKVLTEADIIGGGEGRELVTVWRL